MGPRAWRRRIERILEPLSPEDRVMIMRELLDLYPVPALTSTERSQRFRCMHGNETVAESATKSLQPVQRNRSNTSLRLPPVSVTPVVSISPETTEETTAVKKQEYPAELQEIPELLRKLRAPVEFDDAAFWIRIDAWLGSEHSGVGYLSELPKYLAWVSVQNGSARHKNLRRGFRNWLSKSEYWSQRHAQTDALRRRR